MTNVLSIDNVASSDTDVAVPQLTQANLQLKGTVVNASTGITISTYVLPTGDPNYPMTITVRTEKNPRENGNGVRRSSITLASWARVVDGDGVVLGVKPISGVIALNTPSLDLEAGDLSDFWGNLYGLTFGSLSTKVPSTDHISQLQFGLTELF